MSTVFADAYYFLALLNTGDKGHPRASAWTEGFSGRMVTTDLVLLEVADAMSQQGHREVFWRFYDLLHLKSQVQIIPATRQLIEQGLALYRSRPDKGWSLTDCISFSAMNEEGLRDALTGDRHFEQAGFTVLLK